MKRKIVYIILTTILFIIAFLGYLILFHFGGQKGNSPEEEKRLIKFEEHEFKEHEFEEKKFEFEEKKFEEKKFGKGEN